MISQHPIHRSLCLWTEVLPAIVFLLALPFVIAWKLAADWKRDRHISRH
jgi:hypothetical protein